MESYCFIKRGKVVKTLTDKEVPLALCDKLLFLNEIAEKLGKNIKIKVKKT